MKSLPRLSGPRAAEVFKELVDCRRMYATDGQFFKMTEFLEELTAPSIDEYPANQWRLRIHENSASGPGDNRAGVVMLDDSVTFSVNRSLWQRANRGAVLDNYILAHEVAHVALDHHASSRVIKNFVLFDTKTGKANAPPNAEELEANYGAVFLQCGFALLDERLSDRELSKRAFTDDYYVNKARKIMRLDAFRRPLLGLVQRSKGRVVL